MKIQLLSDAHNIDIFITEEYMPNFKEADLICHAGDMGCEFYEEIKGIEDKFFGCYGNHWWYGKDIRKEEISPSEVKVLINGDYVFLATTLWTNFDLLAGKSINEGNLSEKNYKYNEHIRACNNAYMKINDFKWIKNSHSRTNRPVITPFQMSNWHWQSRKNLQEQLDKYKDKKCVIITHFAPSIKAMNKKYEGDCLNSYFMNNMEDFILGNPQIVLWHYGHLHTSSDFMIGNCRCIENSIRENENYKELIIEI